MDSRLQTDAQKMSAVIYTFDTLYHRTSAWHQVFRCNTYNYIHKHPYEVVMFTTLLSRSQQQLQKHCADCITRRQITSAQKRALQRKQQQANKTNNNATTTSSSFSKQPPTTQVLHKNIAKAPHMQKQVFESTSAGKTKGGLFDTISANPLVFAIFIFPTVMMGVALIVRPDFRAQILGGGGGDDDDKKNKSRTNATISVPENAPEPLYDSETSRSSVISAIEESKEQSQGGEASRQIDEESDDIVTKEKTKDLIYALGIRPHPSLR